MILLAVMNNSKDLVDTVSVEEDSQEDSVSEEEESIYKIYLIADFSIMADMVVEVKEDKEEVQDIKLSPLLFDW